MSKKSKHNSPTESSGSLLKDSLMTDMEKESKTNPNFNQKKSSRNPGKRAHRVPSINKKNPRQIQPFKGNFDLSSFTLNKLKRGNVL